MFKQHGERVASGNKKNSQEFQQNAIGVRHELGSDDEEEEPDKTSSGHMVGEAGNNCGPAQKKRRVTCEEKDGDDKGSNDTEVEYYVEAEDCDEDECALPDEKLMQQV